MTTQPTPQQWQQFGAAVTQMKTAVDALQAHVENLCGLFMDSCRGWDRLKEDLQGLVHGMVQDGKTVDKALASTLLHGEGDEPTPASVRHVSPLGERIEACSPGGFNERTLSGLCVVSIYSHWEDKTRGEIAKALGIEQNAVRSGLFSDIRRMRNALLHAGGRIDTTKPFEVLQWFKCGDVIVLTPDRFHEVVRHLRQFPEGLHTPGFNPFKR